MFEFAGTTPGRVRDRSLSIMLMNPSLVDSGPAKTEAAPVGLLIL
jgi:hypothetical protein